MDINLSLFFRRTISLSFWAYHGNLERELALFEHLQERGVKIDFYTYGGLDDLAFRKKLSGIRIFCNQWGFSDKLYEFLLPFLHGKSLRQTTIIRSNQIDGADIALRAARFWRKPFIARGGYIYSFNTAQKFGSNSSKVRQAERLERKVFSGAEQIIVTTPIMKEHLSEKYHLSPGKFQVIPNYVNTSVFQPDTNLERIPRSLCYIGRLNPEKNVLNIIEAVKDLGVRLTMIGQGPLRSQVLSMKEKYSLDMEVMDFLPNKELPAYINRSEIYIQPSQYEGHPKTILEAMACAAPVIGANTVGTRELISHGENGWLCEPTVEGIRTAVLCLLKDEALRKKLGKNARQTILENYALEKVVEMELALYRELLEENKTSQA